MMFIRPILKKHTLLLFGFYLMVFGLQQACGQTGKIHHFSSVRKGLAQLAALPPTGSHVYWFEISTSGYGAAPFSMISPSATGAQEDANGNYYVQSDSQGNFSITAWNSCPSSTSYQYILVQGGDIGTGQTNPYLAMSAIIPVTCGIGWSLDITEQTTAAAAFALGAFATVATDSFATDSNSLTALQGAITYANSLINTTNSTIPSNSAWQTTLNTVANIIATCSQSTGTTACTNLFAAVTPPGGVVPTDTFQAALDIALNPNVDLTSIFNTIPSPPWFGPALTSVPSSWNLPGSAIQITGIAPSPAPAGTTITVGGSGFGASQGSGTLVINGIQANITSWSDTAIVAIVPSGAAGGGVAQVFQNNAGSNQFPFKIGPIVFPTITSLSLNQGPPQMGFLITGANFGSLQGTGTVSLGGTPLIVLSWSNTAISVQLPQGVASGNIVVTVGGAPSFPVTFTVTAPFGCS